MKVNYFGAIAEMTHKTSEDVELKNTSLSELLGYLKSTYKIDTKDVKIAVNHDIISPNESINLKESDEIAILSSFAGG